MLHPDPAQRELPGAPDPVRRRIARFSLSQGGAIGRRQLLRGGVTPSTIGRMIDRGDLWPRYPGVYAVGRPALSPYGEAWAAILATRGVGERPNARGLGSWSAAAALGVAGWPSRQIVLVAGKQLDVPGIDVVRVRELPAHEILLDRNRLPVTVWWRTLLDLPRHASLRQLEDVLSRSERRGLLDLGALVTALDDGRGRGRQGIARLRRALEPYTGLDDAEYRSLLERLAHLVMRDTGLPEPEINGPVTLLSGVTIHVDLLLRDARIAIEVDGRDVHQRTREFELDRERDRELHKLGLTPLRFTWWDVRRRPQIVPRDVRAVLARRGAPVRAR